MEKTALKFEHQEILWLLLAVPGIVLFLYWSWRDKNKKIAQFVQSRLLAQLTIGVSVWRQVLRRCLLVLAATLILIGIARPQWGFTWEEAKQRGIDILIAIDASRSMLAEDVIPYRLERAKLAAVDLVKLAKTDRLGLIAFAGTAFLQCPLTLDENAFRQSLNAVSVDIMPQGGTTLAEAIDTAVEAFKENTNNHRILVIFTDGEDHESGVKEMAQMAAEKGIRIFTVGVGTQKGELLRITDQNGKRTFLNDSNGNAVKSRLNESMLQEIAGIGKGFYLPLKGSDTMEILYQRGLAELPGTEISSRLIKLFEERHQWFLLPALILLIIESLMSDHKPPKRPTRNTGLKRKGTMSVGMAIAITVLLTGFLTHSAAAGPASDALKHYKAARYDEALNAYQQALTEKPDDARLLYNAGASAYGAGKWMASENFMNRALNTEDLDLQQKAYYNLGNARYRLGASEQDPQKKMEYWENAIKSF
ncbi:MAG TPA: VWA domain-containing protein, partial [Verrucomicrobia bacterium]|nr:VWA domain-containing protein [Verrucomicrobiota bacterium]